MSYKQVAIYHNYSYQILNRYRPTNPKLLITAFLNMLDHSLNTVLQLAVRYPYCYGLIKKIDAVQQIY